MDDLVTLESLENASVRISPHIHETPIYTSEQFNQIYCPGEQKVFFKCDNFQKCGSFKIRGALNALKILLEGNDPVPSVVTHSSGNFGQALAYASQIAKVECQVVCPENTLQSKKAAMRGYGALITQCPLTEAARQENTDRIIQEHGSVFIHPYAHEDIIAGQGTCGLEILRQVPQIDAVLVPCGGGGLLSGVATAMKLSNPDILVYGVEPELADDAQRSFRAGRLIPNGSYPSTICDGLRTSLSPITFRHVMARVDGILTVSERQVADAVNFLLSRMKLGVEPSGAVGVAALMDPATWTTFPDHVQNVVIVISGGNFDFFTQMDLLNSC